jgi:hypothetical protein
MSPARRPVTRATIGSTRFTARLHSGRRYSAPSWIALRICCGIGLHRISM